MENLKNFSEALLAIRDGEKVSRLGWNGKGIFLFLVPGSRFVVNRPPLLGIYEEGTVIDYKPHIDMKGVDGTISVWAPSINDVLAEDWITVY